MKFKNPFDYVADLPGKRELRADYVPTVGRKAEWIAAPVRKPEKPLCAPKKRRKGKHYLSGIAEKVPGKLPVLPRVP